MPFYAVVVPREDGDADCLAAFDVDTHANMSKSALDLATEYRQWADVPHDAEIILIENVTSVIEEEYWNECVLGKDENVVASWNYTLDACCPRCFEYVDLSSCESTHDYVLQDKKDV